MVKAAVVKIKIILDYGFINIVQDCGEHLDFFGSQGYFLFFIIINLADAFIQCEETYDLTNEECHKQFVRANNICSTQFQVYKMRTNGCQN